MIKKVLLSEYLDNPCGTCATAFWKNEKFAVPENVRVVHERNYVGGQGLEPTRYFRLLHNLENINDSSKDGFCFRTVDLSKDLTAVKSILDECYNTDYSIDEIIAWTKYRVFDNELWIFVIDKSLKTPVALGIADFDSSAGEGSLEWIQVLPKYQGLGIGSILVNELLKRLKTKVNFATVSGQCDNKTNPERLYRKCGFVGNDIWYVTCGDKK